MKYKKALLVPVMAGMLLVNALPASAQAPTTMPFTGRLVTMDGPVDGVTTVTFRLFDAETNGSEVWSEVQAVDVVDGVVTTLLGETSGLDEAIFDGAELWLEVDVEGDVLSPRSAVGSVPYATFTTEASHAENADTCTNANQLGGLAASSYVTGVTASGGLTGGGNGGVVGLAVDTTTVQSRVSSGCPAGQAIRAIAENGNVTCENDDVGIGDITGVGAQFGLNGGGTSGSVALSVDTNEIQRRVAGTCPAGQSIRAISPTGGVTCEVDTTNTGDITSVTAGAGLTGGGSSGAVTVNLGSVSFYSISSSDPQDVATNKHVCMLTQTVINSNCFATRSGTTWTMQWINGGACCRWGLKPAGFR